MGQQCTDNSLEKCSLGVFLLCLPNTALWYNVYHNDICHLSDVYNQITIKLLLFHTTTMLTLATCAPILPVCTDIRGAVTSAASSLFKFS